MNQVGSGNQPKQNKHKFYENKILLETNEGAINIDLMVKDPVKENHQRKKNVRLKIPHSRITSRQRLLIFRTPDLLINKEKKITTTEGSKLIKEIEK